MNYSEQLQQFFNSRLQACQESKLNIMTAESCWKKLIKLGTELWLDTGDMDAASEIWDSNFTALTTNNTLLNKEIQKGIYDSFIPETVDFLTDIQPAIKQQELILEIAFMLNAWHGLRLVRRFKANVSVELHTHWAHDIESTVTIGQRFYDLCPDHFIIKVPFTAAGLIAAARLSRQGVPVNFTLGFSARQNYLAACFTRPAYVNVFMGRLNAFVANNNLGSGDNVGEKATLATQRVICDCRNQAKTGTRLIGASMRSAGQVADLAGVDVYTMPVAVATSYAGTPPGEISSQIKTDPDVDTAPGIALSDFYGDSLWEVADDFKTAVHTLARQHPVNLTPEALTTHLADAGCGDLLPAWSKEQLQTVTTDGKIPVFSHWQGPLQSRQIGLDALMNISALHSFIADQQALDARIASLI